MTNYWPMSQSTLMIEDFNGTAVSFRNDGWVNATQMAKPFGKRPVDFIRLPVTHNFLAALAKEVMCENPTSLFDAVKGHRADGRQQGTWMHPDLALEFARWLSPEFAIWTNRVIRRVMSGQSPVDTGPVLSVLTRAVEQIASAQSAILSRIELALTSSADLAERVAKLEQQASAAPLPAPSSPNRGGPVSTNAGADIAELRRAIAIGREFDVGSISCAIGMHRDDLYSRLRLWGWISPESTLPTELSMSRNMLRVSGHGRVQKAVITSRGARMILRKLNILDTEDKVEVLDL